MSTSSNWTMSELAGEPIPFHARMIFIIVGIFYIVAGLVGNVVIILTVVTNKVMHNPHYYFIINLAVADLTIIAYVVPWTVVGLVIGYYPVTSMSLCVFNGVIIVTGYLASLMTLMVISINRYLNICHREIFAAMFSRKILSSIIYCSVIWCLAFLSALPALVGWSRFHFDVKTHYCGYDRTYNFYYTLFLMLWAIGIPVIIVLACNIGLWWFIRRASRRIHHFKAGQSTAIGVASTTSSYSTSDASSNAQSDSAVQLTEKIEKRGSSSLSKREILNGPNVSVKTDSSLPGNSLLPIRNMTSLTPPYPRTQGSKNVDLYESNTPHSSSQVQRNDQMNERAPLKKLVTPEELSLIKSLFVVFVCFAVLMTPYMMACLLDTSNQWPSVVHLTCTYTSFTNTCINWVVYGVMNKNFKRAYKKLFCCKFGKSRKTAAASASRTDQENASHLQHGYRVETFASRDQQIN
ncbi:melatonin receptor type 1A-like [Biomphalaria glabrata]|uniref:Melatonin receptor type 1A-like n=1 Tax=Biomphalaria glabrata TaxID=6526 RepID=A0A9U8EM93_BIOGL|nr:melatonin receptor type 1A-like [Biomphalaria glabrata]